MTALKVVNEKTDRHWQNPWWVAFFGLETDILELRNVITLAAMAFEEDKNAAAFCIYDARDRAEALKAKYGELWHKALKQA